MIWQKDVNNILAIVDANQHRVSSVDDLDSASLFYQVFGLNWRASAPSTGQEK